MANYRIAWLLGGSLSGSGSGSMVMREAGLAGLSQYEAIRTYIRDLPPNRVDVTRYHADSSLTRSAG